MAIILKNLILHITLFFSLFCFSQNEQLAQYYYDKGDFEKAKISFEELLNATPQNTNYFQKTIDCYQQLQLFSVAEKAIQTRLDKSRQAYLLVELGYNFQLQKNEVAAKKQYDLALERIQKNPNEVYSIANAFERKVLLNYALQSYETAVEKVPTFNFNYQMALLYGQLGNTEKMIATFLDEAYANPQNSLQIQNQLARFSLEDGDETFNASLRKELILRTQKTQDVFWNQYLSWFYVQQKEFGKAFIQEKAIYKRNPESLLSIVSLGDLAAEEGETETAKEIFEFILQNTQELELLIQAQSYLMRFKIDQAQEKDFENINTEISTLLKTYEISPMTIGIQSIQAHFLAFQMRKIPEAKGILKNALELPLNPFEVAKIKMELADILLLEEKYNQALLYYSQIEDNLKNDALAHEASLKAAKTSYFQGDFAWALKQFSALKSASTQLIANDALEYFLLLTDNTVADSTQTALKQFAKGDYLWYQNRNQEAINTFQEILKSFKGQDIEPVTLLRLGQLYEKQGEYLLALAQFQDIIEHHQEAIYKDEALFFAAEIYAKKTNEPDKAKSLYEKIIFNHQDSIFFVEARKEYRKLRGDKNL